MTHSKKEIIELIKRGKSITEIRKNFGGIPSDYNSALRELIKEDNVESIMDDLARNLPQHIFFFRRELEKLYHASTGEYLPSSYSIGKIIERIYENGHRKVLFKILKAMVERGIKEFEKMQEDYPSLKNEIDERIGKLKEVIEKLNKLMET